MPVKRDDLGMASVPSHSAWALNQDTGTTELLWGWEKS